MSKASVAKKLKQYEVGRLRFAQAGDPDNYDRHLVFDHAVSPENASQRERFEPSPARCATCSPSAGC